MRVRVRHQLLWQALQAMGEARFSEETMRGVPLRQRPFVCLRVQVLLDWRIAAVAGGGGLGRSRWGRRPSRRTRASALGRLGRGGWCYGLRARRAPVRSTRAGRRGTRRERRRC